MICPVTSSVLYGLSEMSILPVFPPLLDWIEQSLTSHSTHLGHFGDGGVTAASARIVAAVRAHSVCGVE